MFNSLFLLTIIFKMTYSGQMRFEQSGHIFIVYISKSIELFNQIFHIADTWSGYTNGHTFSGRIGCTDINTVLRIKHQTVDITDFFWLFFPSMTHLFKVCPDIIWDSMFPADGRISIRSEEHT